MRKIVLLPGLDGTGMLFRPLAAALPEDVEVQVVSYPNKELTYSELVEFVMGVLPDEEFVLVGESFSGPIAYQVALHQPKNLRVVIFVATFLENPRFLALNLMKTLPLGWFPTNRMPAYMSKLILGSSADDDVIEMLKDSLKMASSKVLACRLREIASLRLNLRSCGVKAVYIQALDDWLVPKRCLEKFEAVFSQLEIYRVEGPHFVLQTNPNTCAHIIANTSKF